MSGLFAKVGMDFLDHEKFQDAEDECIGSTTVWLWLTVWARKHEKNGDVPLRIARKHCLIGGEKFDERISCLQKHGLAKVRGETVFLTNYASHNETKEEIAERRAASAERLRAFRSKNKSTTSEVKRVSPSVSNAFQPPTETLHETRSLMGDATVSPSVYVSDLLSGESLRGVQETTPNHSTQVLVDVSVTPDVAQAFAEGVSAVTKHEYVAPTGKEAAVLIEVCAKNSKLYGNELIAWTKEKASEWAKTAPTTMNAWKFKDWFNGGEKQRMNGSARRIDLGHAHQIEKEKFVNDWPAGPNEVAR